MASVSRYTNSLGTISGRQVYTNGAPALRDGSDIDLRVGDTSPLLVQYQESGACHNGGQARIIPGMSSSKMAFFPDQSYTILVSTQ